MPRSRQPRQVTPDPSNPGQANLNQANPGPATRPVRTVDGFQWSDGRGYEPDIHPFDNCASGVTPAFLVASDGTEPEYFEFFFDDQVMTKITEETNNHHAYLLEHMRDVELLPHSHIRGLDVFPVPVIMIPHS
ncbi:hypothetical protein Pcinc_019676 [Petrolisthes cinctipes]|uniref:Uncharacterized protein n=1 Tax=Petrolisthes cinctipes TaxID=88211 RepID=A0AAE1FKI9_PETCI|nr:hypothetical protein Pcinc_019676 [Petrolisthes cinctipes]